MKTAVEWEWEWLSVVLIEGAPGVGKTTFAWPGGSVGREQRAEGELLPTISVTEQYIANTHLHVVTLLRVLRH